MLERPKGDLDSKAELPKVTLVAIDVHKAYVSLIKYADDNKLAGFLESSNFELRVENAKGLFVALAEHEIADSLNKSLKLSEEVLSNLSSHITSVIGESDSCGNAANQVVDLFLGEKRGGKLKYQQKDKNFHELTASGENLALLRSHEVAQATFL